MDWWSEFVAPVYGCCLGGAYVCLTLMFLFNPYGLNHHKHTWVTLTETFLFASRVSCTCLWLLLSGASFCLALMGSWHQLWLARQASLNNFNRELFWGFQTSMLEHAWVTLTESLFCLNTWGPGPLPYGPRQKATLNKCILGIWHPGTSYGLPDKQAWITLTESCFGVSRQACLSMLE